MNVRDYTSPNIFILYTGKEDMITTSSGVDDNDSLVKLPEDWF